MRAALYARVSTEEQAREEKVSLEGQTSDIERYCQSKGYELVKPYYVDIQSGSDTIKNRPEFERMLSDAGKGLFNVIVAWQPDRLFRSMWPAARLKRTIDETGIDIEAVKQPLDKRMLGLWAWLAEMEIENFKERSRMGKRGVAVKGKIVTRCAPYGYYVDKDMYPQIDESEAYVVQRIFKEFVIDGKPVKWIARDLNSENASLRIGGKFGWTASYIYRILKNKTYIGQGSYGINSYVGKKRKKLPQESRILIPFPPIVNKDLFDLAQEKLAQRSNRVEKHPETVYLLRDLVYCQECGYKFLPRTDWKSRQVRKSGQIYEYHYKQPSRAYKCYGMFRYPDRFNCRQPGTIRATDLEELAWQKLAEIIENPAFVHKAIEAYKTGKPQETGILDELEMAKRQFSEWSWKRQKAINLHLDGVIDQADLGIQLKFIDSKKEFFESEISRLTKQIEGMDKHRMNLTTFQDVCSQIKGRLKTMADWERREVSRLLIHRIWIDREGNVTMQLVIPENVPATCDADMKSGDSDNMCCPYTGEFLLQFKGEAATLAQEHGLRQRVLWLG